LAPPAGPQGSPRAGRRCCGRPLLLLDVTDVDDPEAPAIAEGRLLQPGPNLLIRFPNGNPQPAALPALLEERRGNQADTFGEVVPRGDRLADIDELEPPQLVRRRGLLRPARLAEVPPLEAVGFLARGEDPGPALVGQLPH